MNLQREAEWFLIVHAGASHTKIYHAIIAHFCLVSIKL